MNKYVKPLLTVPLGFLFMYLLCAFGSASFNIAEWVEGYRMVVVVFTILHAYFIVGRTYLSEDK